MIKRLKLNIFRIFGLLWLVLMSGLCIMNIDCYAQILSSNELINNAAKYDGKIVIYQGEVIGDIMVRGQYSWINVYDSSSAIGVWIKTSLVKNIKYTGSYKFKGDIVGITGIFRRACINRPCLLLRKETAEFL